MTLKEVVCSLGVLLNLFDNSVYVLDLISLYNCYQIVQALPSEDRRKILLDIANALEANKSQISEENEADVEAARDFGYDESLVARLALKPEKASLALLSSHLQFTTILIITIISQ